MSESNPVLGEFDAEEEADDDPFVGRILDDRFRVDDLVGAGGMGRVYRGHQLSVERNVAIKVLRAEFAVDEGTRERFFREARVVSGLSHPNIVQLIDFGRDDEHGLLFLVMELVEGVELRALLEQGRIQPELALRIAHQVAGALVEAHEHEIVHRDLKADNVILVPVADGSLQAKVLDFGVAFPKDTSDRLTMTGHVHGTASYMAPEQARGVEVDERADLFSLGILLFEMLTGRLPVEGESNLEVMVKQIEEGPPPLASVLDADEFPREVLELVDELVAIDRENRPSSATAVRKRLERIFRDQGWQPIRLDRELPKSEVFDPWLRPPIDLSGEQIEEVRNPDAAIDSNAATEPASPDGVEEASGGGDKPRVVGVGDEDVSPHAPTGEFEGRSSSSETEDSGSTSGLVIALVVGVTLLLLVGGAGAAYLAWTYWSPPEASPVDSLERAVAVAEKEKSGTSTSESDETSSGASEPNESAAAVADDESDDESGGEAPEEPGTDPVCGDISRDEMPSSWLGTYEPRGDGEASLEVRADQLFLRWETDGGDERGATLFAAQTKGTDAGDYEIECARKAGFGAGDQCQGVIRRRGPVLTVHVDGNDVCADRFSGSWMRK